MRKPYVLANILLILAICLGDLCYMAFGGLWLKSLVSGGFLLLGLTNLLLCLKTLGAGRRFPVLMVLALALAWAGDVVINLSFVPGATIFGVGHIFYGLSYCALTPVNRRDGVFAGLIFLASAAFILLYPAFDFGSAVMQGVCLAYGLVISCMVGKALSDLWVSTDRVNVLVAAGSILFYVSDLMLVLCYFADGGSLADNLCLLTYYPAQCLLAHSIYYHVTREN